MAGRGWRDCPRFGPAGDLAPLRLRTCAEASTIWRRARLSDRGMLSACGMATGRARRCRGSAMGPVPALSLAIEAVSAALWAAGGEECDRLLRQLKDRVLGPQWCSKIAGDGMTGAISAAGGEGRGRLSWQHSGSVSGTQCCLRDLEGGTAAAFAAVGGEGSARLSWGSNARGYGARCCSRDLESGTAAGFSAGGGERYGRLAGPLTGRAFCTQPCAKDLASGKVVRGLERKGRMSRPGRRAAVVGALRNLGLTREEASAAVSRHPELVNRNDMDEWASRVAWLKARLGLSEEAMKLELVRRPVPIVAGIPADLGLRLAYFLREGFSREDAVSILKKRACARTLPTWALSERIEFLCSLGVPRKELPRMLVVSPEILGCSIDRELKPRVEWLAETVGMHGACLATFIQQHPYLLAISIDDKLQPTVEWFASVGVQGNDIATIIEKFPSVLHISINNALKPTVDLLASNGVHGDALAAVLRRCPHVLASSVDMFLKPAVKWLVSVGIHGDALAVVLRKQPNLLLCSLEQLTANHQCLLNLGLVNGELSRIYTAVPQILTFDLERPKMQQKIVFIKDTMRLSPRDVISKSPQVFSCSLEKRLRLRFLFRAHIGHPVTLENFASVFFVTDELFHVQGLRLSGGSIGYKEFREDVFNQKPIGMLWQHNPE
ncbi:unnamed protein product [Ostreobium quekettii]|uniref:mTERF domain-containing protein 1, mitochondrial n=1 Tax=Ostreobium quekettii TaxID=121088 RepID=A0A8S1IMQ3_9CHLO|nr:unnamed protein product [Ostreobium quekettii]|eukprot:evm.model.scf_15EXC.7 EVM.evm.TU.scf_15EXC.7   scf_15EXC:128205-130202(-)